MTRKLHSWWRYIRKHWGVALVLVLAIVLALIVYAGYRFNWEWTGFGPEMSEPKQHAKTLWDWFNLLGVLAIPAIVGLGVARFTAKQEEANREQRELEQEIAIDNQHQAMLQDYFNHMSNLLFEKNLRQSELGSEVRTIARARTLTLITRLDVGRKRNVIDFLYEAGLIDRDNPVISLKGASLIGMSLDRVNLRRANLAGVDLRGRSVSTYADLTEANLQGANLSDLNLLSSSLARANLRGTNLIGAHLFSVNLQGANLEGSHIFGNLHSSNLDGAIPRNTNLVEADLSDASLVSADLSNADLGRANLNYADLTNANLTNANLTGAIITKAVITKEQLDKARSSKDAIGIDTIRATKPSPNEVVSIDDI